ncbi:MAG TPA: acyltransferase [Candidatus Limnocylindrales bacterium]
MTAARPTDHRSAGLDALRAFACLMVVAFHAHTVAGVPFGPLDPIVDGGNQGVFVFFALSGYLLYRPFLRAGGPGGTGGTGGNGGVDLRAYAIKRAARILPGYYVALVALTLLTGTRLPFDQPIPYLALASAYQGPLRDFLGSAWTLSAEVLFYVTLPLIAWAVRGREALFLSVLALASATVALALRLYGNESTALWPSAYPAVFYAFVPGMLLAVLQARHPEAFARLRGAWAPVCGAILLVLGTLTQVLPVALFAALGTPLLMGWVMQRRVPGARLLAFLGGASYAMYLWNKDALLAFGAGPGLLVAAVGSALSWGLVERPILDWAHRVSKRPAASDRSMAEARPA